MEPLPVAPLPFEAASHGKMPAGKSVGPAVLPKGTIMRTSDEEEHLVDFVKPAYSSGIRYQKICSNGCARCTSQWSGSFWMSKISAAARKRPGSGLNGRDGTYAFRLDAPRL